MAWQQLIEPNLSTQGKVGFCLAFARNMFGVSVKYPNAWKAWEGTTYKHANYDFPPVAVLIWFRHPANGTTPGHVAVRMPDGKIYSSPYRVGTTHAVLGSIEEVEKKYSSKYVGWSEDINNIRVAQFKEDTMDKMTDKQAQEHALQIGLALLYSEAEIHDPNAYDIEYQWRHIQAEPYTYATTLLKQQMTLPRWKELSYKASHYDADVAAAAGSAIVLSKGKYEVK